MFTGIITDVGAVRGVTPAGQGGDTRVEIWTGYDLTPVALGASIACSGVCLTLVDKGEAAGRAWFAANVSAETLRVTTLGAWRPDTPINLERALKVGDELGGHIVQGHVDGVGRIEEMTPVDGSTTVWIGLPEGLAPFVAQKGSIAVDGVSLTVNQAERTRFSLNIIPHTWTHTAFSAARVGDAVNLEIDVLARYVSRLKEMA